MFQELPPRELFVESENVSPETHTASFGIWNLYRRYGKNYLDRAAEMTIKRMDKWGLNTLANWSDKTIYDKNRKAFILPLENIGFENELMGLMDVYDNGIEKKIDEAIARNVAKYKNNHWLIGYFIGNEPAWISKENRLCSLILNGKDRPIKTELQNFLKESGDTPDTRKTFIYNTFEKLMKAISKSLKKNDPNHLNLGIRYGYIEQLDDELLRISKESFDALSFNCYALSPDHEKMNHALEISGLADDYRGVPLRDSRQRTRTIPMASELTKRKRRCFSVLYRKRLCSPRAHRYRLVPMDRSEHQRTHRRGELQLRFYRRYRQALSLYGRCGYRSSQIAI